MLKGNEHKICDHSAEKMLFLRRVLWGFIFVCLLITILLITIFKLQFIHYSYFAAESIKNSIEIIIVPPKRGVIYDRNHIPIATNEKVYQLMIVPDKDKLPAQFPDLNSELEALKPLVHLTEEDIKQFQEARKHYAMHREVPLKNDLSMNEIHRFAAQQHLFANVVIEPTEHRYYPYGAALAHVLGYMSKISDADRSRLIASNEFENYKGTSEIGKSGIEKYYESVLHGEIGYKKVEITSRRKIVRELENTPPKAGQDVELTLDLPLQLFIFDLLKDRKAAVVAIDPKNGDILALVSTPSFDPNLFVGGISGRDYAALRDDPMIPLYNRSTLGAYAPASTVKPFMAIAALNENVITPKTVIYSPGYWQLPNSTRKFRDWRRFGHGSVGLTKSIAESVDTFYYQVAYDLGIDRISKWMAKFGFGQKTGVDLSSGEETAAILPSRDWKWNRYKQKWLPGDTISIGIGQGYWTATPLQLAKALTILVNNGKTYTPHLFKQSSEIEPRDASFYLEQNALDDKVNLSDWNLVKQGMNDVLFARNGTAHKIFKEAKYQAAGKSGTAQVFSLKENESYNADTISEKLKDNALFVAYAPYKNPEIALVVVLENGGSGSSVGGAIAKKILDYYLIEKHQSLEKTEEN